MDMDTMSIDTMNLWSWELFAFILLGEEMKAGSAAKLIVDALLQRFLPLARRRIETAQVQVKLFVSVYDILVIEIF